jgi:hypothetical protein
VREVFETLERLGIRYYVTGSEALGRYATPRQTMDVDIVADLPVSDFPRLSRALEARWLVADPLDFDGHVMASFISRSELAKIDVILRRGDTWADAAMDRRERWEHPAFGPVWVISLEDLLLAKLDWSDGTSELQLRDCRSLVQGNRDRIDWTYVDRHAPQLGVEGLVQEVRDAA